MFTDADLPYDLEALPYLAELINERGYHLAVGDRTLPGSMSMTSSRVARKVEQPDLQFRGSHAGHRRVSLTASAASRPSTAGLRTRSSRCSRDESFSGDVELLYIALKYNLSIRRIPVRLQRSSASTVKLRAHSLPMLVRILALRQNWTWGLYASDALAHLGSQPYWTAPGSED